MADRLAIDGIGSGAREAKETSKSILKIIVLPYRTVKFAYDPGCIKKTSTTVHTPSSAAEDHLLSFFQIIDHQKYYLNNTTTTVLIIIFC